MATVTALGGCNIGYISGLYADFIGHYDPLAKKSIPISTEDTVESLLTRKIPQRFGDPPTPVFIGTDLKGCLVFSQGADHDPVKYPYTENLKNYILAHNLGTIVESGPVPNVLHSGRPTYFYMWIVDRKACERWWQLRQTQKLVEAQAKANKSAVLKAAVEKIF